MKRSRLLSLGLAFLLVLSLLAPATAAPAFADLNGHWGETDCREMVDAGLFTGYTDGTFRPNATLTTTEALVLCARMMGVNSTTAAQVLADRTSELNGIFGLNSALSWAYRDFALCLESGILSHDEMVALNTSGALSTAEITSNNVISKQDLAMYMIRAMQLEPLAQSQTVTKTNYNDEVTIAVERKPYVYLMTMYGIVKGDEQNQFAPYSSVTRSVMATMLSRSLKQMALRGISVELGEYTNYRFAAGAISKVEKNSKGETVVSLANDISGGRQVTFDPTKTAIVVNNMAGTISDVKVGQYARIALDSRGEAAVVRLTGSLTTISGAVNEIDNGAITITSGATTYTFPLTRFTEVKAGETVGDRNLILGGTGYVAAVCKLDSHGNLVQVQLSGGTRSEQGIITAVETSGGVQYVRISGFDGIPARFAVTADVTVTINAMTADLRTNYIGAYASYQLKNDNGQLTALSVDTTVTYVQGTLSRVNSYTNRLVTIENSITKQSEQYKVSTDAKLLYEGEVLESFNLITRDTFATAQVMQGEIVELYTSVGTNEVEGKLSGIAYGSPITLTVERTDGVILSYIVDPAKMPNITRNDKTVTIDKLVMGDKISLSLRYQVVERITAVAQEADYIGVIQKLTQEATVITFEVLLENGELVTYTVPKSIPVTQDGNAIAATALKYGDRIAMIVAGEQMQAIELKNEAATTSSVSGSITYISEASGGWRTIIVRDQVTGADVNLRIGSNTTVTSTTGETMTINRLTLGDSVIVYYKINNGVLEGTLIIR